MSTHQLTHGDFTGLADLYSRYRSGYAPSVASALLGLLGRPAGELDAVDVGAGTGIWSRMLAGAGCRSVVAVEPNAEMRARGELDSRDQPIRWQRGRGEDTGLPDHCADLLTMASSFHWVDFETGTAEFCRVLRPGGWFVVLYNPRVVEASPVLADIEAELTRIKPDLVRVTSGRTGLVEVLADKLWAHPGFDDLITLEGRQIVHQTPEQYLGAWRSVNDIQVQLGPDGFRRFLDYAARRVGAAGGVDTLYLTRAWAARRGHDR
jgi:ubiquinone/menaquinone biosynthesis C-methylase UbiE